MTCFVFLWMTHGLDVDERGRDLDDFGVLVVDDVGRERLLLRVGRLPRPRVLLLRGLRRRAPRLREGPSVPDESGEDQGEERQRDGERETATGKAVFHDD